MVERVNRTIKDATIKMATYKKKIESKSGLDSSRIHIITAPPLKGLNYRTPRQVFCQITGVDASKLAVVHL